MSCGGFYKQVEIKIKGHPLSNLINRSRKMYPSARCYVSFYAFSLLDIRFKAITKLEMNIMASIAEFVGLLIPEKLLIKGLVIE